MFDQRRNVLQAEIWLTLRFFIDVLHRTDVNRITFFDESGFKLPDVCNPKYGHSLKGERAIEIHRYTQTPNVTLNLLISFQGVSYANILQGPSDTDTYLQFFLMLLIQLPIKVTLH